MTYLGRIMGYIKSGMTPESRGEITPFIAQKGVDYTGIVLRQLEESRSVFDRVREFKENALVVLRGYQAV